MSGVTIDIRQALPVEEIAQAVANSLDWTEQWAATKEMGQVWRDGRYCERMSWHQFMRSYQRLTQLKAYEKENGSDEWLRSEIAKEEAVLAPAQEEQEQNEQ